MKQAVAQHGPLLAQLLRFGVVGLLATALHAGVYGLAVSRFAIAPLLANPLAFAVAFSISFVGHHRWTFAGHGADGAMPRFLATALLGLASNQCLVWLLVEHLGLPPLSGLLGILLLTPALVFVTSKYWAFATPRSARPGANEA
jgi:putative flippase GtrA